MAAYVYITVSILMTMIQVNASEDVSFMTSHYNWEDESFDHIETPLAKITDETVSSKKLARFTKDEFTPKKVIKVGEVVYVAVGYAIANSIMIEGNDGIIIVDTTENIESMKEIMTEFRKITKKPVRAMVYTHFHDDHFQGTTYVVEEEKKLFPDVKIEIYAHKLTKTRIDETLFVFDIGYRRAVKQFGVYVNPRPSTGLGIGPFTVFTPTDSYVVYPTVTFTGRKAFTEVGIDFELIHTPGETDDQITVWLPKYEVAMPGDNIYKTFPNLYAIRGTPARSSKIWYESLDKVRVLGGKYLVGSHTLPVVGKEAVYDTLLVYRDGIKYVHDQTLRLLNKGYVPDEIVDEVRLPDTVSNHPFLQEHYGTVPWSVRSVFTDYIGWFSGDPKDLKPMTALDRAVRMVKLITYAQTKKVCAVEVMLQEAEISHKNSFNHYLSTGRHLLDDDKWALELADTVLTLVDLEPAFVNTARQIKVSALRAIGVEEISANGRNYFLSCAKEVETNMSLDYCKGPRAKRINGSPIDTVLQFFCLKVRGSDCQHKNYTISLTFTDVNKTYALTLRNSVCDVTEPVPDDILPQVSMETTTVLFKNIKAKNNDLDEEVKSGKVKIKHGTLDKYKEFLECFDPMNSL